jgi:SAM-dependent methyltransferase
VTSGVGQIVRFNWPFYAMAGGCAIAVTPAIAALPAGGPGQILLIAGLLLALAWIIASLTASWIVYDASPLMEWRWLRGALGFQPRTWINIHASLDQSTPALRAMFAPSNGRVFDIFDPIEMTEPSIARARRLAVNAVTPEPADFRCLPAAPASVDAIFLLLSAHELRTDAARATFAAELRRILAPGGRIVVAEHLRNWANFAAFGPGAFHFHSRRTWLRCFTRGGFVVDSEFSITPFVRVFVLRSDV